MATGECNYCKLTNWQLISTVCFIDYRPTAFANCVIVPHYNKLPALLTVTRADYTCKSSLNICRRPAIHSTICRRFGGVYGKSTATRQLWILLDLNIIWCLSSSSSILLDILFYVSLALMLLVYLGYIIVDIVQYSLMNYCWNLSIFVVWLPAKWRLSKPTLQTVCLKLRRWSCGLSLCHRLFN